MRFLKKTIKWLNDLGDKRREKQTQDVIDFIKKKGKEDYIKEHGEEAWEKKCKDSEQLFSALENTSPEGRQILEDCLQKLIDNRKEKKVEVDKGAVERLYEILTVVVILAILFFLIMKIIPK